jgi:hypothetical protein
VNAGADREVETDAPGLMLHVLLLVASGALLVAQYLPGGEVRQWKGVVTYGEVDWLERAENFAQSELL